ncbi:MAG TPA: type II secretion system protein GspN [Deltaproteobacteria bacterium]|nr:type II secretion system protein GspN [Deltaproteobacteria bacterium]
MARTRADHPLWLKIGFGLYACLCLVLFVYQRFPYDRLKASVEEDLTRAIGAQVTLGHIRPGILWGFIVEGLDVKGTRVARELSVSPNLLSLLTGRLGLSFSAAMTSTGGGEGYARLPFETSKKPMVVSLSVTNMDMSSLAVLFPPTAKPKGSVTGEFSLITPRDSFGQATGSVTLTWKKGTLPLNIDALPLDAITFETLDLDARIDKGILSVRKADFAGEMSGSMRGNIRFFNEINRSRLNLTGELTLPESMKSTLGAGADTSGRATRFSLRGSLDMPRFRVMTPLGSRISSLVRPVQPAPAAQQQTPAAQQQPPAAPRQTPAAQQAPAVQQDTAKQQDNGTEETAVPEGGRNE